MEFEQVQEVLHEVLIEIAFDTINNKMLFDRGDISSAGYNAVKADILSRTAVIETITNKLEKKFKNNH